MYGLRHKESGRWAVYSRYSYKEYHTGIRTTDDTNHEAIVKIGEHELEDFCMRRLGMYFDWNSWELAEIPQ